MTKPTERDAIEYIRELFQIEQDPRHQRVTIHIGPASAFIAISTWQLSMRHPEFSEHHREMVQALIDQLKPIFTGTMGEWLLDLGDRPELDVPNSCRYPSGPHHPDCPPGPHAGFAPGPGDDS